MRIDVPSHGRASGGSPSPSAAAAAPHSRSGDGKLWELRALGCTCAGTVSPSGSTLGCRPGVSGGGTRSAVGGGVREAALNCATMEAVLPAVLRGPSEAAS